MGKRWDRGETLKPMVEHPRDAKRLQSMELTRIEGFHCNMTGQTWGMLNQLPLNDDLLDDVLQMPKSHAAILQQYLVQDIFNKLHGDVPGFFSLTYLPSVPC